jgi:predicted ATPase
MSQYSLNLASKKVKELIRVAEANRVKNLPSAITETQASISEANKSLAKNTDPAEAKRIVDEIEKEMQAISSLGVVVDGEDLDELIQNTDKRYAEYLISELENNALTEEQEEILNQMKELAEEGNYSAALELYLTSQ